MTTRRALVLIAGVVKEIAVADALTAGDLTTTGNTILGDASTDTLNVGNGGLIKDESGNVGIGVTPAARFDLATGTTNRLKIAESTSVLYFDSLNAAATTWMEKTERATNFNWFTAASGTPTTGMRLDAAGNLGLGIAPFAWSGAGKVIDGPVSALRFGTGSTEIIDNQYYDGANWRYKTTGPVASHAIAAGIHYFYTGASGTAGAVAAAVERMRITVNGNVNIGGANTGGFLSIKSPSINTALEFDTDAATGSILAYDRSIPNFRNLNFRGSFFTFGVNDVEKLRIDASGNVISAGDGFMRFGPNSTWASYLYVGGNGPGGFTRTTTTASVVTTNGNLHLDAATDKMMYLNYYGGTGGIAFGNGASGFNAWMSAGGSLGLGIAAAPISRLTVVSTNAGASGFAPGSSWGTSFSVFGPNANNPNGSALALGYDSTNEMSDIVSLAPGVAWRRLRVFSSGIDFYTSNGGFGASIDASGNVIAGNVYAPNFVLNATAGTVGYGNNASVVLYGGSHATPNILTLFTNNVERIRIDASGIVMIGTSSTAVALPNGMNVRDPSAATNVSIGHANGTASGIGYLVFAYNSGLIGSITQNGTTQVLFNTVSDRRLKAHIADAPDAGALIDAIRVRTFDWKAAPDEHVTHGFIAQELVEVAPQAVHIGADEADMWGVDAAKLMPLVVRELQSLRSRVRDLETVH